MNRILFWKIGFIISIAIFSSSVYAFAPTATDPLPSWNDGSTKQSIINFVNAVSDANGASYVPPAERIATFDNDGTLWVEQPLYTQGFFAIERVKALAPQHPEWKQKEPFKSIIANDFSAIKKFSAEDIEKLIAVTHSGMSVEDFSKTVSAWLASAHDSRFKHPYTELVYQPMLEAMNYLRKNNFKVYIVSGGGQDFMRTFSEKVYGVPVEQVIGSAVKTKYTETANGPVLIKMPEILLNDDKVGKPQDINLFIGRKPIIAFGNSDGDQQMLEWTQSGAGKRLMLLVHHDDAAREYAYDTASKVGTFSAALMNEANQKGWKVISMKNDWKVIFPFDKK